MKIMIFSCLYILIIAVFTSAAPVSQEWILIDLDYIDEPYTSMVSSVKDELGNYFEGDMLLTLNQHQAIKFSNSGRNGLRDITKRWPNCTVIYYIVEMDFDDVETSMIENAMLDISSKSCIKFRQRENDEYAVKIQGSDTGCFSNVGYVASNESDSDEILDQVLNLSKGCFNHGTIVHEILHTLGFYHMQSTYDRDDYVKIVWENIRNGTERNFAKYKLDTVSDFGVTYDYDSVMHYPDTAFSINGNKTIITLQEGVKIGQRIGLSEKDIIKLNKMYCYGSDTRYINYMSF